MANQQGPWRNWGDHPIIVAIATIAALLAIFSFFRNRDNSTQPLAVAAPTLMPTESAHDTPQPPATIAPLPLSPTVSTPPTATPAPTAIPVSPTPLPGLIPLAAPDNPNVLNPILGWQPGSSKANDYNFKIHPGALTLIAGPYTEQWSGANASPLVLYSFQGDFEAQVKVIIKPTGNYQFAGFGVRSRKDNNTFLRIDRGFFDEQIVGVAGYQDGLKSLGESAPYSNDEVYLKITRQGTLFILSYSANANNWVSLKEDFVADLTKDVQIYLYAFSSQNNEGITAQFYDFAVVGK